MCFIFKPRNGVYMNLFVLWFVVVVLGGIEHSVVRKIRKSSIFHFIILFFFVDFIVHLLDYIRDCEF